MSYVNGKVMRGDKNKINIEKTVLFSYFIHLLVYVWVITEIDSRGWLIADSLFWSFCYYALHWLVYWFIIDFISGCIHCYLDNRDCYALVKAVPFDPTIRIYTYPPALQAVKEIRANSISRKMDLLCWRSQRHHVYPLTNDKIELDALGHVLLFIPLVAIYLYGADNNILTYICSWIFALLYGVPIMFFTHYMCHARQDEPEIVVEWYQRLQDCRIVLWPKEHNRHHRKASRYYCVINGWANTSLNKVLDLIGFSGDHLTANLKNLDARIKKL